MSFRFKVMVSIAITVVVAVWAVAWAVSAAITRSFEARDSERTAALVAQFRREFARRGDEVARRVEAIAGSTVIARLAVHLAEPQAETAAFVNEAQTLANEHSLDLLELVAPDGTIISSAQWPARFGYREEWLVQSSGWQREGVFLKREEVAEGPALGMIAVREVKAGNGFLYVAGGERLNEQFLDSLLLPERMRVLLYRNLAPVFAGQHLIGRFSREEAHVLQPLIEDVREQPREITRTVTLPGSSADPETITLIPLGGRTGQLQAVLLIANSGSEVSAIKDQIRRTAMIVAASGVLLGIVFSFWTASHVTRPVRELASTVRNVAAGDWSARAAAESDDEIGQLAHDFNHMTEQLAEQRERMLQAERVAAWRELARRLAHELKNPLFPLQITIENLQRARDRSPEQFEEVFKESTATLLAELDDLKRIIGRFSDFAKMPAPHLERVCLNDIVRDVMRLFEPQLRVPGRPEIAAVLELDDHLPFLQADSEQIRRALHNLVLNAMDAMPEGGTLAVRTRFMPGKVALEVSDTGLGLTKEERERLFTPYYTTKQYGTGLGLAIVQSVVSDHGGSIHVESEPGRGATFRIELKV